MAEILKVEPSRLEFVLQYVTRLILSGKVIAFPTDTVYGLGADPFNLAAVSEVVRIKRRSVERPLPLLVESLDQALTIADDPPPVFFKLAEKFWPGPLTIVVPASRRIPLKVTANTGRVGIRWPQAPLVLALVAATNRPLVGTSANLTGHPPCFTAEEVAAQIGDSLPVILDGGPTKSESASTVVEVLGDSIRVIRAGAVPESELKEFLT